MDDFEEKLNSILASPEAMGQIMALAGSLSGGEGSAAVPAPQAPAANAPPPDPEPAAAGPLAALGDLDPAALGAVGTLLGAYRREDDEKAALLRAMAPFLREERRARLERAVQLTRVSRVIRAALGLLRERGHV